MERTISPMEVLKADFLNDAAEREFQMWQGKIKILSLLQEVDEIYHLEKEVFFALKYFQDVVEKSTMELLSGSTTVILENIFVLDNHIQNTMQVHRLEDPLVKTQLQEIYRYLAVLVSWSDQILLRRSDQPQGIPMRRHAAIVPSILALRKHIKELVERYKNLVSVFKTSSVASAAVGATNASLRKGSLSGSAESLPVPRTSRSLLRSSGSINGLDKVDCNGSPTPSDQRLPMRHFTSTVENFSLASSPNTSGISSQSTSNQSASSGSSLQSRSPSPQLPPPPFFLENDHIYSECSALFQAAKSLSDYSKDATLKSSDGYTTQYSTLKACHEGPTGTQSSSCTGNQYDLIGFSRPPPAVPAPKASLESLSDIQQKSSPPSRTYRNGAKIPGTEGVPSVNNRPPPARAHSYVRSNTYDLADSIRKDSERNRIARPEIPQRLQRSVNSQPSLLLDDDGGAFEVLNQRLLPQRGQYLDNRDICPLTKRSWFFAHRTGASSLSGESSPNAHIYEHVGRSPSRETFASPRFSSGRSSLDSIAQSTTLTALDATKDLIFSRNAQGKTELRGGTVDALIVDATTATKRDFAYQAAFIVTYRTFIDSATLINKLLYRYSFFAAAPDLESKSAARNAFSLLLRVLEELCLSEAFREDKIMQTLLEFVNQLLLNGNLSIARGLRKKILDKHDLLMKMRTQTMLLLAIPRKSRRLGFLLDFKSQELAEQMTLLDAELFKRIEITEFLSWTKEQDEEAGPNLTCFTDHFNKLSFWARTRILEQFDHRDREKYFVKFIKIMRSLKRLKNFNSYLAILAAVDCAPVRRLDFAKSHIDALNEMSGIINSSQSFRAYRSAIAEVDPPCIPYLGVALQDLTFVNENADWLDEAHTVVNFSKRWQQYHILDQLIRFQKTCHYGFQKNENIVQFFNNYDNHLPEEALWQISENIKPRVSQRTHRFSR